MARFRLLTPDAQYADDGAIERQTAGADVDWEIRRSRTLGEMPAESVGACDALVVWHEMNIDRAFVATLKRCRIIVRAGVGFDHIDLARRPPRRESPSAIRPTTAPARSPTTPSA